MSKRYRIRRESPLHGSLIMGGLVIVFAILALVGSVVYALTSLVIP